MWEMLSSCGGNKVALAVAHRHSSTIEAADVKKKELIDAEMSETKIKQRTKS